MAIETISYCLIKLSYQYVKDVLIPLPNEGRLGNNFESREGPKFSSIHRNLP